MVANETYDEQDIVGVDEDRNEPIPMRYSISSYGADFDVKGLVGRLNEGDIIVPEFQRNYVWKFEDACRLIESILSSSQFGQIQS
jgi:hypothetical protein